MSELHIRINKRLIERLFFLIVIAVLAVLLYLNWDSTVEVVDDERIPGLEQEIADLTSQLDAAQTRIQELEEANQTIPEPEPQPEPGQQLSGDIEVVWDVRMEDGRFVQATVVFDNGRDRSEDLTYRLFWQDFSPEIIFHQDTLFLASGRQATRIIASGEGSIPSRVPNEIDTIVLRVTDSAGNLVAQLQERVR